jgi:hypothetical protein
VTLSSDPIALPDFIADEDESIADEDESEDR